MSYDSNDAKADLFDRIDKVMVTANPEEGKALARMLLDAEYEEEANELYKAAYGWEREEWAFDVSIDN